MNLHLNDNSLRTLISWLIEALDSSFMTVWHGIAERGLHYSVHSAEIIIHIKKMKFDYIPQNTQKLFQTTKALTMKGKMFRVCYQKILLWPRRVNHFLKLDKIITIQKWRVMCACVCLVTQSCPTLNSTYLKIRW